MSIRIYKLAKELKLDSKRLVEVCPKVGITGKGSALASLTEEEADKVKSYIGGKPSSEGGQGVQVAPAPKKSAAKEEETSRSQPEINTTQEASSTAESVAEASASETKQSEGSKSSSAKVAPRRGKSSKAPEPAPLRREDYIAPGGAPLRRPSMGNQPAAASKKPVTSSSETASKKKAPAPKPTVRMAPMPAAPKQKPPKKTKEPEPQKPELRLPPDMLKKRAQQSAAGGATADPGSGSRGLSDRIRKSKSDSGSSKKSEAKGFEDFSGDTSGRVKRGGGGGGLLGGREERQLARQQKKKKDTPRRGSRNRLNMDDDVPASRGRSGRRKLVRQRNSGSTAAPRKGSIAIQMPCTVRSFSEAIGVSVAQVLRKLMQLGSTRANINAELDFETAELLAAEMEVDIELKQPMSAEDELFTKVKQMEEESTDLKPRAPVITFLGHVDHGKTSLLDRIIGIDVVSGESGGITQHIRAYHLKKNGNPFTFVDTPGHEAFTEMRARGADVTDIAVLVVAADDGVMPQTEEAISHARAANVPIIVALNKIDLQGVDPQKVMHQLAMNELQPSEWGGDVEVVPTSAITGEGIDDLLEMISTIAELHELKAPAEEPVYGTCLEAELHEGRGVVAKMILQSGTLRQGDAIVCGTGYGKVKSMYDTLKPSKIYQEVGPSFTINLTGLDEAPQAGEKFYRVDDITKAREIAETRRTRRQAETQADTPSPKVTLESLADALEAKTLDTLNLILRADTRGSIEAIKKELGKLHNDEVQVRILQATVGGITEADVYLGDASNAIIVGFNVVEDDAARNLAKTRGVQIRRYDVIYEITEHIKQALERKLKPEEKTVELGRALVQKTFSISRVGTIAGCLVLTGIIQRDGRARLIRDSRVIGDYPLDSLRRVKDDAREVKQGLECGIRLGGYNDIKEGDVLEVYRTEEVARTL
ncbi:Translation initiation factor IF-2 [Planctomycetales bacterium 10988]|nr:Translation initiation factor IF-2 [Planctomycetales bacterium 10988]